MEVDKFRLIEEVRRRPLLWDFRHVYESRNNKKISELWQEIAKSLKTEVSSCKLVWQKLRTTFFNEMRRIPTRVARAKRKGTYDPNKKYNIFPFFDALQFVAHGRSMRGVSNDSLEIRRDIKFIDNGNSGRNQSLRVKKIEDKSFSSEIIVKADSQLNCRNFKSYSIALYTDHEYNVDNYFSNDKDRNLIQDPSSMSKTEVCSGSVDLKPMIKSRTNNVNQAEGECRLEHGKQTNATTLSAEKKAEYDDFEVGSGCEDNVDISAGLEKSTLTVIKPELGLGNTNVELIIGPNELESNNHNHSVVLEEKLPRPVDGPDRDYQFMYSLVPLLKQMLHSQKLQFRYKMSNLMLDIFSTSPPVTRLDKHVVFIEDNDPETKFLLSFLPFIKSMSVSQSVQFRQKIADLVLNISAVNELNCGETTLVEY